MKDQVKITKACIHGEYEAHYLTWKQIEWHESQGEYMDLQGDPACQGGPVATFYTDAVPEVEGFESLKELLPAFLEGLPEDPHPWGPQWTARRDRERRRDTRT